MLAFAEQLKPAPQHGSGRDLGGVQVASGQHRGTRGGLVVKMPGHPSVVKTSTPLALMRAAPVPAWPASSGAGMPARPPSG